MKQYILTTLLIVLTANTLFAQLRGVELIAPKPNDDICLGTPLLIKVRYSNRDIVAKTLALRVRITNIVTGITIYARSYTIPNVPEGFTADTTFEPFVTDPGNPSHLGSFRTCAYIDALTDIGDIDKDWPLGDSMCLRLFGIRRMDTPFRDPFDNYDPTAAGPVPSHVQWVSLGAEVVNGRKETWDAPPPSIDKDSIPSAVLRLDRTDVTGTLYPGQSVGDTLISFPLNLKGQAKALLTFSFMRAGRHSYPALFDADTLLGPEPTALNAANQIVRKGDSLVIEFKDPSAGACEAGKWNRIAAIDGGQDFEFQSFWMAIDSATATYRINGAAVTTLKLDRSYLDSAFRFRLRIKSADNSTGFRGNDDADPWYIDNVYLARSIDPELEVSWVRVVTPYTKLPYSATTALPVYLKVKSLTTDVSSPVPMNTCIISQDGDTVYNRTVDLVISGFQDTILRMPDWNAQNHASSSQFTVIGKVGISGYDNFTDDNETSSLFFLNVERGPSAIQEFALDHAGLSPTAGVGNDVAKLSASGAGIGFDQTSGSMAIKFILTQTDTLLGSRLYFGSGNQNPEAIRITVLRGDNSTCIPLDSITSYTTSRGPAYDQFSAYYFPTPVVLQAGVYWLSVSQLTPGNFMLGGSFYRGGANITVADQLNPKITAVYTSPYGTQWWPTENNGAIDCMYALETPAGSGSWLPWMAANDYWPMHASGAGHPALAWNPQIRNLVHGGSYTPLIRPIVGSVNPEKSGVHSVAQGGSTLTSFPNPFSLQSGNINLRFNLLKSQRVNLAISNAIGEVIYTALDKNLIEGVHMLQWNGRDLSGRSVAPGVYLCRLQSNDQVMSVKFIIID